MVKLVTETGLGYHVPNIEYLMSHNCHIMGLNVRLVGLGGERVFEI